MSEAQEIKQALEQIEKSLGSKLETRLNEVKAGFNVSDQDAKIKALESEHAQLKADLTALSAKSARLDFSENEAEKTAGHQFIESVEIKSRSRRFVLNAEIKALTGNVASVGSLLEPKRLPMHMEPTEPHIRDLISRGVTSARSLKFPQRKTWTNAAAPVAETALKPQSDFTFEMVTTEVKKIAHYIKASDEILDDEPALKSYIDAQLIEGLLDVEDAQILKGDGIGQNQLGLYTVAAAFNRAKTGDTLLDTLMRAQTQLRLANRTLSGYIVNPQDWEEIMLLKGTDNKYVWLNATDGTVGPRILATPVRDTTKLAKGEWLAGDFKRGAQLFDRQQANITVANQNEDDFVKNMITILAEERLALVIYDRLSFVKNAIV